MCISYSRKSRPMEHDNNSSIDLIRTLRKQHAAKMQDSQDQPSSPVRETISTGENPSQKDSNISLLDLNDTSHSLEAASLSGTTPIHSFPPFSGDEAIDANESDSSQPPTCEKRIPTPPPLPPPSAFTARRYTSSSGKTPATQGASSDSEGRHVCTHGVSYPPLDELLKFGRVSRTQLIEVEKRFDSERFHCVSHMICEGIYTASSITQSDHLVIEDLVPLSRNEFDLGLQQTMETHLRSRLPVTPTPSSTSPTRTRSIRQFKATPNHVQTVSKSPPPPSERSIQSYDYSIDLPEQLRSRATPRRELRFSDEVSSPTRQRITHDEFYEVDSEPHPVIPLKKISTRNFEPSKDTTRNMSLALEACSLPQIFSDVRLTFLHYIHQSLYSLHLRSHVKIQSYPKPDILDLLIIGRDLCDQRRRYNSDIRHPQLLKLFLKELFSRRSRKVRSNCFEVPMLREGHAITLSLALEAFTSFHRLYQVAWNQQFGQMVTPPFI